MSVTAAPVASIPIQGLTESEAQTRRAQGRGNDVEIKSGRTYPQILRDNVFTFFYLVFFGLGLVMLVLGNPKDAFFTGIVALFNVFVTTFQEVRAKRQLDRIAGEHLPPTYRRKLQGFRHGPGVFKMDFALDGPIPWTAPECAQAATEHVGGTLEEIAMSERAVGHGQHPERPFVLVAQSSLFDPARAPDGMHTAWAYCHVPNGSTIDMSDRIEAPIERLARSGASRSRGST